MCDQILNEYPEVDLVVRGEGEETLKDICLGIPAEKIPGIAFRREGGIVKTPPRAYVENLDNIPFPAWHLVDLHRYPSLETGSFRGIDFETTPRVSVVFSRGCVGQCTFCSTWRFWRGWRCRSASNMVAELDLLYHEHGIRHFCFADDCMTVDRQATMKLCDEILKRDLRIAFHVTTRADAVDRELLVKLYEAGCYKIAYGVETGSKTLLEQMNKKSDVQTIERAIALTKEVGIRVTTLIIIGNVGENDRTVEETRDFLYRTQPDGVGQVGGLWILPGTKLYRDAKKKGFIDDSFWLGKEPYKIYTLEHSEEELARYLDRIASFREKRNVEQPMTTHQNRTDYSKLGENLARKWQQYVFPELQEYSASSEWEGVAAEHRELMTQLPSSCVEVLDLGCGDGLSTNMCVALSGAEGDRRDTQHAGARTR